jgi:hypothetical protein
MIVTGVSAFEKQLQCNEAVAGPDDRPLAQSERMRRSHFRWITAACFSMVTVGDEGGELLLGTVELVRKRYMLEREQDVFGLECHQRTRA